MANTDLNEKWTVLKYNKQYFHNYLISDFGRVVTNKISPKNRKKKPLFGNYREVNTVLQNRGYIEVYPYTDDKERKYILLHRCVWESFVSEIPKELVLDHKDNNKVNNELSNLQLLTKKQNTVKYHTIDKFKK